MNLKLSPSKDSPPNSQGRSPETTIARRASLRSRSLSFWLQRPLITQTKAIETVSGGLSKVRLEMIEACGRLCQLLGLPRTTGQIYGLLYLALEPLSLNDIAIFLQISKGSASNGTRQLASWGAIKGVWIQGDRRDYYQAAGGTERFDPWCTQRFHQAQIEFLS